MSLWKKIFSVFALSAAVCSAPVYAKWPEAPVTLVVGYSAGGPVDTSARIFAKYLADVTGQSVIVENKPGAAGMLGAGAVQRGKADGLSIYFAASPAMTISPILQNTKQFDTRKDFTYLGLTVDYTNVLVMGPQLPQVKTLSDLIAHAKANPGQVTFGSAGIGASNHLSAEVLASVAGVQMKHIPYKGNSPALLDVIAGRTTFMFDIIHTSIPYIESKKITPLVVTSAKRNPALPDVPAAQESGGALANYEVTGWYGLLTAPNLPKDIQEEIAAAIQKVNSNAEYKATMLRSGYTINNGDGEALRQLIIKEYAMWEKVIQNLPKQ